MNKTHALLNEITANLGVLYIKLHQHHFYVKGRNFHQLHALFEENYDTVHDQFDEVAERLLMLGGKPVSTLGEFLNLTTIKEAPYTVEKTADEMLQETLEDYKTLVGILESGIGSDFIDEVSEDLLIEIKAFYDKQIWMLKATLS